MLFTQLQAGLSWLADAITQDTVKNPVWFPKHPVDCCRIYSEASIVEWFAVVKQEIGDLLQLEQAAAELPVRVRRDAVLRGLITEYATGVLNGNTVEYILALTEPSQNIEITNRWLYSILQRLGVADGEMSVSRDREREVDVIIAIAHQAALKYLRLKVGDLKPGEARCPVTHAVICERDLECARPVKNIFFIAAGNARGVNLAQFSDREANTILDTQLAALSIVEREAAEEDLDKICTGQATLLHADHLKRLSKLGINADNPAVRTPRRRAQDRFLALGLSEIESYTHCE
jgi:hypothetical protein